jgi:hypothetical protein
MPTSFDNKARFSGEIPIASDEKIVVIYVCTWQGKKK